MIPALRFSTEPRPIASPLDPLLRRVQSTTHTLNDLVAEATAVGRANSRREALEPSRAASSESSESNEPRGSTGQGVSFLLCLVLLTFSQKLFYVDGRDATCRAPLQSAPTYAPTRAGGRASPSSRREPAAEPETSTAGRRIVVRVSLIMRGVLHAGKTEAYWYLVVRILELRRHRDLSSTGC